MNLKPVGILLLLMIAVPFTGIAQDATSNKFGKGITVVAQDSSFSMKFSTRFQTLYDGKLTIDDNSWSDKILIRRARLKFDGFAYSPKLQYKVELGLSNRDHGSPNEFTSNTARMILDAVIKWNFVGNWTLWVGQTKLPGNRERIISSSSLQFVDRSIVNSRFTLDRDIGIQIRHKDVLGENFVVKEIVAVSQGEGRNITADNFGGYDYTFKVELLPFGEFESKGDYFGSDLKREETPKLAVGLSYDFNDGAVRQRGQQGSFMEGTNGLVFTDLSTFLGDFMFKYKGFSAAGEYGNRQNIDGFVAITGPNEVMKFISGSGFVLQAGYLFDNNFELAGRFTTVAPDDPAISGLREQTEYTLGVSKYIVGHSLKVQSDASLLQSPGRSDELRFRLQMELSF